MDQREPRHDVQLPARLRDDDGWTEIRIRNVSARGLMLVLASPPAPRTYVEVRWGSSTIVGRVMWAAGGRCGLRTKERISVAGMAVASAGGDTGSRVAVERSALARVHHPEATAAKSAYQARIIQFAATLLVILAAAAFAGQAIHDVLSRPSAAISAALG